MADTIHGCVTRVYYADARFSAGLLQTDAGERVRFRGKFYAAEGDRLSARGVWQLDPKYGHQFEVQHLEYELPQTPEGLALYLSKHPAFEGIGPKTAAKIAAAVPEGASLDSVLRDTPEVLVQAGVPQKTVTHLIEAWNKHASENTTRAYLAGFGLTHHQMQTLIDRFGTSVVSMLKHDPYLLIKHLSGYGFKKVDAIALKLGVAKNHPGRIEAALSHCLREQVKQGHTWTPGCDLVDGANDLLAIDSLDSRTWIEQAGQRLLDASELVADGQAVAFPHVRDDELLVRRALEQHAFEPANDVSRLLAAIRDHDLGLEQAEAYRTALMQRVSVISGGAGTGKTYVVARLTDTFIQAGLKVTLCAPTGKAAKRVEQLLRAHGVDLSASTIHRLLGYNGAEFRDDTIDADVVIVDEVSMVDVGLMAELLRHLDLNRTRLILVGDHHQLPPVGPGNVLRDLIQHNLVPATVMTQVHRQAGVLKTSSVGVLRGRIAQTGEDAQSRWVVIDQFREALQVKTYLRDLILHELPERYGFDPKVDVQVLTPEHRGELGTRSLNQMLQHLMVKPVDGRLAVGDKVIQTRNDYDLGVMNGTIGFVRQVDHGGVVVEFEGAGPLPVPWSKTRHLDLAYALTAHKAQGSEFPCVVVVCHKSHYFADRNWLYTAVTRASHTCVLLGDGYGLRRAARQVRNMNRRTLLSLWASRMQARSQEVAA